MLQQMLPLVTVVTLTYNKFQFIYDTIDSVLEQSYPNIEYIISDDGSKNFPGQELNYYIEARRGVNIKRYKVISNECNCGTVKNLNNAYRAALGDILIPLSADDIFYDKDVIKKIVNVFIRKRCNLLVTSRMICDEFGCELKVSPSQREVDYINKLNTPLKQHIAFITDEFYHMASGSALYISREFFNKFGYFDESYFLWEDGPFLTKVTMSDTITHEYSIISIKYRLGGISNGKTSPIMRKDRIHYNNTDRISSINALPWYIKRKVKYISRRYICKTKKDIILLYVLYLDVIFCKLLYKIKIKG